MISHSNYVFFLSLNPFPLLSAITLFNVILGCFFFMKVNSVLFFISFLTSFMVAYLWWVTLSEELFLGFNSSVLISGLKVSFLLFISSEVFFFFSFFWSYFHFFLSPSMELNFCWPPLSVKMFEFMDIPLLNTLILLFSGVTVTVAHLFLSKGLHTNFSMYVTFTFFLGFIFSFFQGLEYLNSFFSMNDSTFGSVFFTLTGFHGVHVLVGSLYLLYGFIYSLTSFPSSSMLCFELACWYWHFVDVIWIFLFFFIYVLSNH